MTRGRRFARGQPPRRDAAGHSLPSDRCMQFVALDLVCGQHQVGEEPLLARFAHDSWHEEFSPVNVSERGDNRAIAERQTLTESDGSTRIRYKFRCPLCGHTPVYRAETIDAALAIIYEQGAYEKVVRISV